MSNRLTEFLQTVISGQPALNNPRKNDRIFSSPKDYLSLVLKSNGVRATVALHLHEKTIPVLYVRSQTHLNSDQMMEMEAKLHQWIAQDKECQKPQYVFWTFNCNKTSNETSS